MSLKYDYFSNVSFRDVVETVNIDISFSLDFIYSDGYHQHSLLILKGEHVSLVDVKFFIRNITWKREKLNFELYKKLFVGRVSRRLFAVF